MEKGLFKEIRKGFKKELENYEGEPKRLNVQGDIAEKILFNVDENGMKTFAFPLNLMKKVNFDGISFNGFFGYGFDFTGFKGVSLDPQMVFAKDLSYANLNGVTIINTFDGVVLDGTEIDGMIYKTWENKVKKLEKTRNK